MSECQAIRDLLALGDDEWNRDERRMVQTHLESCTGCAAVASDYAAQEQFLRRTRTAHLTLPQWHEVQARTERKKRGRTVKRGLRLALRSVAVVVVLVILVTGLNALFSHLSQNASTTTPVDDGTVTITYACYNWMMPDLGEWVEAFHQAYPDIQVRLVDFDEIFKMGNADTEAAGDRSYQVYSSADTTCWGVWPDIVRQGLVYDLTPLIEGDPGFDRADFYPGMVEAFQWEGGTWALPSGADTPLILYDRDVFDEAGVPYPRPGWTQEDFAAAAQALTLREAGEVKRYGFVASGAPYQAYWFVYPRAGNLVDRSSGEAVPAVDSPQVVEAVRWYTDLALKHGVMPNAIEYASAPGEWDYQQALDQMIQEGQAAMWVGSIRSFDDQRQQFNLGVAPLPTGRHAAAHWAVRGQSMSSGTAHPQASWLWLKFLTRQRFERQDNPFSTDVPARRSVAEVTGYWTQWPQDAVDALQYAMNNARIPAEQTTGDALVKAIEAIYGGQPVESALTEAQAKAMEAWETRLAMRPTVRPFVVASPTPVGDDKTAITFAPYGPDTQMYRELAQRFVDEHPDIVIEFLRPDQVAGADCFSRVGLGDEATLDLMPFIETDADVSPDDFYPRSLETFRQGDALVGLPTYSLLNVVLFNEDLFDRAGLPYPQPGWTMNEFLHTALALTQGKGSDKQYGWMSLNNEVLDLDLWVTLQGADLWDKGPPLRPRFDAPDVVEAVRGFAALFLKHQISPVFPLPDFNPDERQATRREKERLVREDRIAMWTAYMGDNVTSLAGAGVGVAPVPQGERQATRFSNAGLFIAVDAEHPEACWEWIKYSSEHLLPSGLPARRVVSESPAWRDLVGEETAAAYLASAEYIDACDMLGRGLRGLTIEETKPYWEAHTEFHHAFAEILEGADAETALQEAQRRAEELLGIK